MIPLDRIREALGAFEPAMLPAPTRTDDRAAVALVLAGFDRQLFMCFIRRIHNSQDRWSGHMAFPGGWALPEDSSIRATAERETREEVALSLTKAEFLGTLSQVPIRHRGFDTDATLSPFVYYAGSMLMPLQTSDELEEAYWINLDYLWDSRNGAIKEVWFEGDLLRRPGIRYDAHIIWGLTYRVLTDFATVIGHPLPAVAV